MESVDNTCPPEDGWLLSCVWTGHGNEAELAAAAAPGGGTLTGAPPSMGPLPRQAGGGGGSRVPYNQTGPWGPSLGPCLRLTAQPQNPSRVINDPHLPPSHTVGPTT
jgi:hypothetical protein